MLLESTLHMIYSAIPFKLPLSKLLTHQDGIPVILSRLIDFKKILNGLLLILRIMLIPHYMLAFTPSFSPTKNDAVEVLYSLNSSMTRPLLIVMLTRKL
jgi:hypothetical protein